MSFQSTKLNLNKNKSCHAEWGKFNNFYNIYIFLCIYRKNWTKQLIKSFALKSTEDATSCTKVNAKNLLALEKALAWHTLKFQDKISPMIAIFISKLSFIQVNITNSFYSVLLSYKIDYFWILKFVYVDIWPFGNGSLRGGDIIQLDIFFSIFTVYIKVRNLLSLEEIFTIWRFLAPFSRKYFQGNFSKCFKIYF